MKASIHLAIMARSRVDLHQPRAGNGNADLRLTFPWWQGPRYAPFKPIPERTIMNQSFDVQGMTCGHCEKAVTQAVQSVDPQAKVTIDRPAGKVQVQSNEPREAIARAIAEEGYPVAQ
jgi:copper chaperone